MSSVSSGSRVAGFKGPKKTLLPVEKKQRGGRDQTSPPTQEETAVFVTGSFSLHTLLTFCAQFSTAILELKTARDIAFQVGDPKLALLVGTERTSPKPREKEGDQRRH